jgi:peptidoglycan/xylan/chitin deacetylase (PgdA/CDA1 family)
LRPFAILSYHRVATVDHDPWQLAVPPATFADQLTTLGEVGRFVTLEGGRHRWARWTPGRTPRFAVTFDDGYVDNLHEALPILEALGVPATVFITTGSIGRAGFWWDALDDAVLSEDRPVEEIVEASRRVGILATADAGVGERNAVQSSLHASLAERPPLEVEPLVDRLLGELGAPVAIAGARPLNRAELVVLGGHPLISIGIHTVHHTRLSRAGVALATQEIGECAAFLDDVLGAAPRALAYPHGDVDDAAVDVARRSGCTCAVTTDRRWVRATDDPMLLPRLTVVDQAGDDLWRRLQEDRAR